MSTAQAGVDAVGKLLAAHPHVRLATPSDDEAIAVLHASVGMKVGRTHVGWEYLTSPTHALAESGSEFFTALFEERGALQGTAALVGRRLRLRGELMQVGYLGNLRISPRMARGVRTAWPRFFGALVAAAPNLDVLRRPRALLTAVLDDNARAVEFLTRRLPQVRYHPLQKYQSITALWPSPLAACSQGSIRVKFATAGDLPRLRRFLASQVVAHGLGDDFVESGSDELTRRLQCWVDFDVRSFVLAEAPDGALLGVVAPRESARALRIVEAAQTLRWGSCILARLRGTTALPGVMRLISLSHLEVAPGLTKPQQQQVVEQLARFAWDEVVVPRRAHGLSVITCPSLGGVPRLRGWAQLLSQGTLYEVTTPEQAPHTGLMQAARVSPIPFEVSTS